MTDCVLIQDGRAHAVAADVTKQALCFEPDGAPKWHPDTIAAYVEVESGTVVVGAVWDGESFTNPPAPPGPTLAEYAAAVRYAAETGGIAVGALSIPTDRQTQAMLTGAFNYVSQAPAAVLKWKTAVGFFDLDAATVSAVALAVGAHVQACFAKEAEVIAAIAAETITTTAQIDAAFAAV